MMKLLDTMGDVHVVIATEDEAQAQDLMSAMGPGKSGSKACFTKYRYPEDNHRLPELVRDCDVVVSLLPATMHFAIAEQSVVQKKHMVTASYVSPEMRTLDAQAKQNGVAILNEVGLDPGIDHLLIMKSVDSIHERGGKVSELVSLCGGLPDPVAADNPLRYKMSWSPRGVLSAAGNSARFMAHGQVIEVPGEELLLATTPSNRIPTLRLEVIPNRDSLSYRDLYGVPHVHSICRGTLRYEGTYVSICRAAACVLLLVSCCLYPAACILLLLLLKLFDVEIFGCSVFLETWFSGAVVVFVELLFFSCCDQKWRKAVSEKRYYCLVSNYIFIFALFFYVCCILLGWANAMHALKSIGLFDKTEVPGLALGEIHQFLARSLNGAPVTEQAVRHLMSTRGVKDIDGAMQAVRWLGMMQPLPAGSALRGDSGKNYAAIDALCRLLEDRLQYKEGEKDMVAMFHTVTGEFADGTVEAHTSRLLAFGTPGGDSAMSATVGYTTAAGAELLLNRLKNPSAAAQGLTGVLIPTHESIYNPIMARIQDFGINWTEDIEVTRKKK
jgi:saccharopine dehydrogenase-like NADP-dependent oxidoreductase